MHSELQNSSATSCISPGLSTTGEPWHVLHVRSNTERRVAQSLMVKDIEAYLPVYRERVKWTDRTVVTERPLFSGYVFTRFSPETRFTVINTPGVVRSLGDEECHLVSCAELEKIQSAITNGYPLKPHPQIQTGTRVKVRSGIFQGAEGKVTELRQQCKVVIALGAVRQSFSLELELDGLEILE